mmetsp:Transcript_32874/g.32097  ORF Transcript_32874/g.32097 Transcript_32874/m.32097 type:complete len:122 (+) Transcript_32874:520-885(+)|eukprot:CAMPEP_0170543934 /NCGR_PEP_ID=MMETSP0211-20121228/2880_1 /TAXON_ID=311385 /ORGANISM="Pseudokeronopsis sp., Strain OXSARD2" /LENGTH=121 /DNA_ID=CAMNT_0010847449 /DNA_START=451 /DNA_END=816 /DNA_ORIENTATION=-
MNHDFAFVQEPLGLLNLLLVPLPRLHHEAHVFDLPGIPCFWVILEVLDDFHDLELPAEAFLSWLRLPYLPPLPLRALGVAVLPSMGLVEMDNALGQDDLLLLILPFLLSLLLYESDLDLIE